MKENRLLDLWSARAESGDPIGCVSTTYTFDGSFFEDECLSRFAGMETDRNEDARSYLIEREQKLSEIFAAVLVDRRNVTTKRSLRWHQLPVTVPRGVLHAKLTLLAWRNCIRVLVGSANLTRAGYRSNYEQMAAFDFTPDGTTPASLLFETIDFLGKVAKFASGPAGRLGDFLSTVESQAQSWIDPGWQPRETRAVLMPVVPGQPSLFQQIAKEWRGTGPSEAAVTSPFFDEGERANAVVEELIEALAVNGERTITFETSGRHLPAERVVELDLPAAYASARARRVQHKFAYATAQDAEKNVRALHAKSIRLQRGDQRMFIFGSSNFTGAGTGIDSKW